MARDRQRDLSCDPAEICLRPRWTLVWSGCGPGDQHERATGNTRLGGCSPQSWLDAALSRPAVAHGQQKAGPTPGPKPAAWIQREGC